MYDEKTRSQALEMLSQGMNAREVSEAMGGKPGPRIINKWAAGYVPKGKRRTSKIITASQKIAAVERLEAGEDYRSISDRLGVAPATVLNWRRVLKSDGPDALRTRVDELLDGM